MGTEDIEIGRLLGEHGRDIVKHDTAITDLQRRMGTVEGNQSIFQNFMARYEDVEAQKKLRDDETLQRIKSAQDNLAKNVGLLLGPFGSVIAMIAVKFASLPHGPEHLITLVSLLVAIMCIGALAWENIVKQGLRKRAS